MQAQHEVALPGRPAIAESNWQPPKVHHLLIEQITSKPVWNLGDLSEVLDTPVSTLNEIIKANPAPIFLLGRRKVMFREDALQWLREVAARNPWSPRTNNTHN